MKQTNTTIISNIPLCPDWFELTFTWDILSGIPMPGQFLTIRIVNQTSPLLRRPFAFSWFDRASSQASIIYQRRGPATALLAGLRTGDTLDCIGPLGNGFEPFISQKSIIAVAGGIGIGPMAFFARTENNNARPIQFVYGCRTASMIPATSWFDDLKTIVCTDDGSVGFKGTTGDYLRSLPANRYSLYDLFCCGPTPMLASCARFAQENNVTCIVSVEQVMACGVGACMGCVVKTIDGFVRSCKDGPVFNAQKLMWES